MMRERGNQEIIIAPKLALSERVLMKNERQPIKREHVTLNVKLTQTSFIKVHSGLKLKSGRYQKT